MQNFNSHKYINVIGVRPHMIVKGRTANGFAIYHTDNEYVIFNISQKGGLKIRTCRSLRIAKKYIEKNGVNIPNKKNIEFRYPSTWSKVKKGQLKYTLDEYDSSDKFLDRLLLQLI